MVALGGGGVTYTPAVAGAPTTGTWTVGQLVVDSNNTMWVCTVAGTPGTWASVAQGSTPFQFLPESYGAVANGKTVTDGAITSATNALACATSTPFTSADVGKPILVSGAGAAGVDLITTISGFTDSGHVTLTANAGTTVSAKGVVWGTDNTAAIKSAIAAAFAYAQANGQYAEIVFQPLTYVVSGAATVGGATAGNAIFPLPIVTATTTEKVVLVFRGRDAAPDVLPHWLQPTAQVSGATLAVLSTGGTNDATNGPAFVIGGPWNGYGETGTFSNMCAVVDGLTISTVYNSTFGGFGFWGLAQARVRSAAYMPIAIVPSGGAFKQFQASTITNQWTIGLLMPAVTNNDLSDVDYYTSYGATYGFMPSEHNSFDNIRVNYNVVGITPVVGGNAVAAHPNCIGGFVSAEVNTYGLGIYTTGINNKLKGFPNFQIRCLDSESNASFAIHDTTSIATADIGMQGLSFVGGYLNAATVMSGGNAIKLRALGQSPGPVSSPQAAPATTVAWVNFYWRDAFITLTVATGTLTALTITGPAGTISQTVSGTPTFYQFLLPAGESYTPTYTGTLTHTVVLI